MKSLQHRAEGMEQGVSCGERRRAGVASRFPHPASRKNGFTLVELLLAAAISVMVFAAMGILLSRSFALWMDGTANWRLAQYSRIARERILLGGFDNPAEGLLSATNIGIVTSAGRLNVAYGTLTNFYGIAAVSNQLYLYDQVNLNPYWSSGSHGWRWAVRNDSVLSPPPEVRVSGMTATHTNPVLTLKYQMNYSAMGRTFTQPCTIRAHLINE